MRRLLLLRHGQSTWNIDERWQGQADPPLSELGERQARAAAARVQALGPSRIVTSDLDRARRTAEFLAPTGVAVTVEPALREREAGEWTGLTTTEIDERYPGFRAARKSPPGFEDDASLLARVMPALEAFASGLHDGDCALVVTHNGVIRTIERQLADSGAAQRAFPNLGGLWLQLTARGFELGDRDLLLDPDDASLTIPDAL
jgi:broad specificity phosphatase PhoE